MKSSVPATPTTASRPPPSICLTTNGSRARKARSASCSRTCRMRNSPRRSSRSRRWSFRLTTRKDLSFDAFFTHIVVHELMHGLGPHDVTTNGRKSTVREELKEAYSALEEAKADISGLFAIQYMIDKGVLPKSLERPLYTTYLASCFRSIRFGTSEAHGLRHGGAVQLSARPRRLRRQPEWHLCCQHGQDQSRHRRPDAGNHDPPGGRQLRERQRILPRILESLGRKCKRRSTN